MPSLTFFLSIIRIFPRYSLHIYIEYRFKNRDKYFHLSEHGERERVAHCFFFLSSGGPLCLSIDSGKQFSNIYRHSDTLEREKVKKRDMARFSPKRVLGGACVAFGAATMSSIAYAADDSSACLAVMYPSSAAFFGAMGAAAALVFANLGSAYGAAKSGIGVAYLGLTSPEKIMRGIVPVVMAGILGIYGLIIAVIINNNIKTEDNSYSAYAGHLHLGAGVAAGLAALGAGLSIGVVGDTAARSYGKQDQIFVAMVLMLIFSEALGLYGLIIALLMNNQANRYTNLCGNV